MLIFFVFDCTQILLISIVVLYFSLLSSYSSYRYFSVHCFFYAAVACFPLFSFLCVLFLLFHLLWVYVVLLLVLFNILLLCCFLFFFFIILISPLFFFFLLSPFASSFPSVLYINRRGPWLVERSRCCYCRYREYWTTFPRSSMYLHRLKWYLHSCLVHLHDRKLPSRLEDIKVILETHIWG